MVRLYSPDTFCQVLLMQIPSIPCLRLEGVNSKESFYISFEFNQLTMQRDNVIAIPEISLITYSSAKLDITKPTLVTAVTEEKQIARVSKKTDKAAPRVKSKPRQIAVGLIISLSALMVGYSLKEITSVPIATIVNEYNIAFSPFLAQSVLIGILPIGSVFGSIITKYLIKKFKRLLGIYIFTIINIVAIILVNVNIFGTLFCGRFLEGICIGYYSAIAPIYLREISAKESRKLMGLFFSFGKIFGVLVSVIVELILEATGVSYGYRIILSLTAVFSTLQAILIFFFGTDTPTQMIEKGNKDGALHIVKKLYKEKYVQQIMNEYTEQYEAELNRGNETLSEKYVEDRRKRISRNNFELQMMPQKYKFQDNIKPQVESENYAAHYNKTDTYSKRKMEVTESDLNENQEENSKEQQEKENQNQQETRKEGQLTFDEKKRKAYLLGCHMCIIRHWTGGQTLMTQAGIFISAFNVGLGHWTPLIVNLTQFGAVIFGLTYVKGVLGKKPLFLMSIPLLSFLNLGLVVTMIYGQVLPMMILMILYMVVYGMGFISPVWAYPSEVIPASESLFPNILHWIALAVSTLVPPIVESAMPANNPFPVFLFFGLYGFFGWAHVRWTMRETDGFTYNEIIKSFK